MELQKNCSDSDKMSKLHFVSNKISDSSKIFFCANRVHMAATDVKIAGICSEWPPASNGTSAGVQKKNHCFLLVWAVLGCHLCLEHSFYTVGASDVPFGGRHVRGHALLVRVRTTVFAHIARVPSWWCVLYIIMEPFINFEACPFWVCSGL